LPCYTHNCIGIPDFCPEKEIKKEDKVNKFAEWLKSNDKKQRGVAEKLGISTSTLHDILRKGQMPSLRLAYQIEQYTKGCVTVYDWMDETQNGNKHIAKANAKIVAKDVSNDGKPSCVLKSC
jgi:DNA-binding XRE family transcriptional regulator